MFGVNRIPDRGLKRLVVSGQRPVGKAYRNPDPAEAIAMQEEWLVASQTIVAYGARRRLIVWRLCHCKVGNVQTGPFLTFGIPPH